MLRNANQNTDAYADGYRFRLELFGTAMNRLTPEFARTKSDAVRRKRELKESGIVARPFLITEDGDLRSA